MANKALPLATFSSVDQLEFGTRISYHHRAGVARVNFLTRDIREYRGWKIVDGLRNHDTVPPIDIHGKETNEKSPFIDGMYWNHRRYSFFLYPQAKMWLGQEINKTVMVWPEDGFGWIIGSVRRSIGRSELGRRYSGPYGEYEPGYHSTEMYVDLYVVKEYYVGTDYILCPIWAVKPIENDNHN